MTDPTAPITQDVLTLPRKLPEGPLNIVGLTRDGLRDALIAAGTPERQAKMRVNQIWQWVYHWGVRDFAQMTNLAKEYRALLADRFVIALPEIVTRQVSEDGTRKYLVRIAGGHEVFHFAVLLGMAIHWRFIASIAGGSGNEPAPAGPNTR